MKPERIAMADWDTRWPEIQGHPQLPGYCKALGEHANEGDRRLERLAFDNSLASFRLWNFLLTEEDRLAAARVGGARLIGTMKDLGTIPVMAYSLPNTIAFYPDGAWWIPCVMELNAGLLHIADQLGVDESFCPVRAMLGAFVSEAHFPIPDLLCCSAGATCDDFSAIAQRLVDLGHPVLWWNIPHRRPCDAGETAVALPGRMQASESQIAAVELELRRLQRAFSQLTGVELTDDLLATGIAVTNRIRTKINRLRETVFAANPCPLPALELLIVEMLAIHFCSDQPECERVVDALQTEVDRRVANRVGTSTDAVRTYWINPVADLRVMNLLEDCGGRLCGTDFMFAHALASIPEDQPPLRALAMAALADPLVGPLADRARHAVSEVERLRAEAVVISRIPGASHCAFEGRILGQAISSQLDVPVVEVEIPPVSDAFMPSLKTRLQALIETARSNK